MIWSNVMFNSLGLSLLNATTGKFSLVFKIVIIGVIYIIIALALRIMYKDIKSGGRRVTVNASRKSFGLEVIEPGYSETLRIGSLIPIVREITIGRKEDNSVTIPDSYVSSHHARIYLKNTDYIIEDLKSTNGTMLNDTKLNNKACLKVGDEIQIGNSIFRVIG